MANGVFIIQEMPTDGSPGERFEWTADRRPPSGKDGGARACPIQPFPLGGKLRTVRTDYPGSRKPSEQVLGPNHKPFKLTGMWDDRYNRFGQFSGGGYARQEMRRFEAMCFRGNPCRFQYLTIVRDGLIVDWDFPYKREWQIGYSFEVSVHEDPQAPKDVARSPETTDTPSAAYDKVDAAVQSMLEAHNKAPSSLIKGTRVPDVETNLTACTTARSQLGATLDNRELRPPFKPVDAFTRLAAQFRAVRAGAFNVIVGLAAARADLDMVAATAIDVLNYEDWGRSLRFMARIAINKSRDGDVGATKRAQPDAIRLYRPYKGESLYEISRKFYGTPHGWRLIYERNALTTFILAGNETLIIPERGGV